MNRQFGYIAHAHILLAGIVLAYTVISKIPVDSDETKSEEALYGTVSPSLNTSEKSYQGKSLFQSKCASCHNIFKDMTGPRLGDVLEKGPWADRQQLYKWIRNPEAFMQKDPYTRKLKEQYGSVMTAFPGITDAEVDAIVEYITVTNSTIAYGDHYLTSCISTNFL